jgi:hypothetical protein
MREGERGAERGEQRGAHDEMDGADVRVVEEAEAQDAEEHLQAQ